MRILVVGASGTIGKLVVAELSPRHEVVTAGRSSGDLRIDIADADSVRRAFAKVGPLDAVVCTAGGVKFGPFADLKPADYHVGLGGKLMGQVQLVLLGREQVADRGSFTLTAGVLETDPIPGGTSASMVNGALAAFVRAAAIEMPRGQRINAVSPALLEESVAAIGTWFPGFEPVAGAKVARAYRKSVEGAQTGQVYRVS